MYLVKQYTNEFVNNSGKNFIFKEKIKKKVYNNNRLIIWFYFNSKFLWKTFIFFTIIILNIHFNVGNRIQKYNTNIYNNKKYTYLIFMDRFHLIQIRVN